MAYMNTQKKYENCLDRMYGLRRFGIILGLDVIARLLETAGNPEKDYKIIHIAGTNGKGSIAAYLSTILTLAGYKTGLFTSPHLMRFNERICINNSPVSDKDVVAACTAFLDVDTGEREPTFFEMNTAMALYAFSRAKVDIAVVETGMGGRLDSTNVLMPEVTIISNISREHQSYLGKTLGEIAFEKAGIIKENTPVITGARQKQVISVILNTAEEKKAPVFRLGKDFRIRRKKDGSFSYSGLNTSSIPDLVAGLPGYHQNDNAALAVCALELLAKKGILVSENIIREGLLHTRWPGRLELLDYKPEILLDGAHNLHAVRNLVSHLSRVHKNREIHLVCGILDDKPYKSMLAAILPLCSRVILTEADSDRAIPASLLAESAKKHTENIEIIQQVGKAVCHALKTAPKEAMVVIAGSLYVVGEAKTELEKFGFPAFDLETGN